MIGLIGLIGCCVSSHSQALVKGMLSPLDQVSRNAFEAALAFALLVRLTESSIVVM